MKSVKSFALCAGVASLCGCGFGCTPVEPEPIADNHFPIARLVLPQIAVAGVSVDVDASGSDDEDGDAVSFVFDFGDGSPEAESDEGVFGHVFAAAGSYDVVVVVKDDRAFEASAVARVVVVDGVAEGCGCDLPCDVGGTCTDRGCLVAAASIDEEAEFDDVVACP